MTQPGLRGRTRICGGAMAWPVRGGLSAAGPGPSGPAPTRTRGRLGLQVALLEIDAIPIRLDPYKGVQRIAAISIVPFPSNVTLPTPNCTSWIVVRLGPVRRKSPPSTRSNRAPAGTSLLAPSGPSSDAARQVVPVQRCADSRHPSPSSGRTAVGFMTPPAGSPDVHCVYHCTSAIPMGERSAPAQDRRLPGPVRRRPAPPRSSESSA